MDLPKTIFCACCGAKIAYIYTSLSEEVKLYCVYCSTAMQKITETFQNLDGKIPPSENLLAGYGTHYSQYELGLINLQAVSYYIKYKLPNI